MSTAKKIFSIAINKYLLAIIVFAVVMIFLDHNNIFEQYDRQNELKRLQAQKAYYEQEIEKTRKALSDLKNNPDAIEKYAREKYFMKKDNEDLFIIEDANKPKP